LEVRDLDSTNGTFVNGKRVQTAQLESGDRLQIGRVELIALRDVD
jgi:pSer/pThr/pTyr-binding forkhead associated (FHA) protein